MTWQAAVRNRARIGNVVRCLVGVLVPVVMVADYSGVSSQLGGSLTGLTTPAGPAPRVFRLLPGAATDIAVGAAGAVWAIGTNQISRTTGNGIWAWNSTANSWSPVPGAGVNIAVDPAGNPWVVNAAHQIFQWTDGRWVQRPGRATDIAVGAAGAVWAIGTNQISRTSGNGVWAWNSTANSWSPIPGAGVNIAVDPAGNPWVVNAAHQIFQWTDGRWVQRPGRATDIAVGAAGAVWAIGTNQISRTSGNGIWAWNSTANSWSPIPGAGVHIAVDPAGNPWVVNAAHQIYGPQLTTTPSSSPVAFVQADDTGTFNGNTTSISSGQYNQVLAHDTGIGHTVILVIQTLTDPGTQTDTVKSISSGMGTFQFVNSYNDGADNEIWICTDTTGAADTMTVNTSTNAWDAFAIEFNQPATGFVSGGGRVTTLNYLANQSWTLSPGAAGNIALVAVDTADAYETGPLSPWTYYNAGYWDFENGTSAAWQVASSASPVTATWQQDGGLVSSQGVVVEY